MFDFLPFQGSFFVHDYAVFNFPEESHPDRVVFTLSGRRGQVPVEYSLVITQVYICMLYTPRGHASGHERRIKPFICGVNKCTKKGRILWKYKQAKNETFSNCKVNDEKLLTIELGNIFLWSVNNFAFVRDSQFFFTNNKHYKKKLFKQVWLLLYLTILCFALLGND